MSSGYGRPLPEISDHNRGFWQGACEGQLRMQHCQQCQHVRYPINDICPRCLSDDTKWLTLSGRGTVFASITFHQVYHPEYKQEVPYNVSMIQLEEGPRMISNVVGVPPDDVKVGQAVEVVFHPVTPEVSIPRFRPR